MPPMKEVYFTYDDTATGVQDQVELEELYEDVGNKLEGSSTRPYKRTQKASPEGNNWLRMHYYQCSVKSV